MKSFSLLMDQWNHRFCRTQQCYLCQEASHAFKMGVPAATHLFNAMSPLQGREPGMVGAIYDDPECDVEYYLRRCAC